MIKNILKNLVSPVVPVIALLLYTNYPVAFVEIYEGSRRWVCGAPMIMDSLEAASGGQVQYQYYLQDRLRSFKKLRIEESRISGSKKTISHNSHLRKALTN